MTNRTQLLAEAVVSAYLNDIAPPVRRPEPGGDQAGAVQPEPALAYERPVELELAA